MKRRTWTPERDALFRAELPTNTDPAALLAALNALPGSPITSKAALAIYAHKKGLRRNPEAALQIQVASGLAGNLKRRTMAGGRIITVWTAERDARLIEGRMAGEASDVTMEAINALPGVRVAGLAALRARVKMLGVQGPRRKPGPPPGTMPKNLPPGRWRKVEAAPPEPVFEVEPERPAPHPALADAAAEARTARVADAIRRSMKQGRLTWESAVAIASKHGVTPRRVMVVLGMVR